MDEGVEDAMSRRQCVHPPERVGHEAELCADVGAVAAKPLHGNGTGALPVFKGRSSVIVQIHLLHFLRLL